MKHQVILDSRDSVKTLKDASLYLAKDVPMAALSCILLELKQKTLSVIACDGHGYYERGLNIIQTKGVKQSLPGKPMRLLIERDSIAALTKGTKNQGNVVIEVDDSQTKNGSYTVNLAFPGEQSITITSPANLDIPDFSSFRKHAEKGKKASVNLGQVMFPVKELTRAGKVFPVQTGMTIPMYISQWKQNGLLTLLESETENLRVIFALTLPDAA